MVHCRTGSLENNRYAFVALVLVHCRTGSLESEERQKPHSVSLASHC